MGAMKYFHSLRMRDLGHKSVQQPLHSMFQCRLLLSPSFNQPVVVAPIYFVQVVTEDIKLYVFSSSKNHKIFMQIVSIEQFACHRMGNRFIILDTILYRRKDDSPASVGEFPGYIRAEFRFQTAAGLWVVQRWRLIMLG